jgi:tRNA A37 threonylcarbamoyladenosine biosynthesis protein TsaE
MVVTSPTYLLDNTYTYAVESAQGTSSHGIIHHMDLYRLPQDCDASILGIPEIFEGSISLVEWPHRLADWEPAKCRLVALNNRVDVQINFDLQGRNVTLDCYDKCWKEKFRIVENDFLSRVNRQS